MATAGSDLRKTFRRNLRAARLPFPLRRTVGAARVPFTLRRREFTTEPTETASGRHGKAQKGFGLGRAVSTNPPEGSARGRRKETPNGEAPVPASPNGRGCACSVRPPPTTWRRDFTTEHTETAFGRHGKAQKSIGLAGAVSTKPPKGLAWGRRKETPNGEAPATASPNGRGCARSVHPPPTAEGAEELWAW